MSTCKDCLNSDVCPNSYQFKMCEYLSENCVFFKDRSKFVELKLAQWVKHKPNIEKMREFHKLGKGKAMGENSIYWTCSICGGLGNLSQKYCSNCGAKMEKS